VDFKKIDSVTFPVKDYAKSATWYAETLGLPEIWRMDEQKGVGFGVGDNSATINLMQEPGAPRLIIQVERDHSFTRVKLAPQLLRNVIRIFAA